MLIKIMKRCRFEACSPHKVYGEIAQLAEARSDHQSEAIATDLPVTKEI
jgi:hypothetical protein